MIRAIFLDIGRTVLDKSREFVDWADWLRARRPGRAATQRHPTALLAPPDQLALLGTGIDEQRRPWSDRLDAPAHQLNGQEAVR
ncbi:hypothetical protein [Micromonospora sp. RP3T]|uniref:hypothetical protein n=1 Tax=Micromonospora sp. RP3T TaxID=2135446 RepID=UPI001E30E8C4|nr:hypothetical protein [Micromonospora sp. RP3T]